MNCKRKYYEKRFSKYPDVVDLFTFRKMLGGIGDTFARRLVRENRVKHTFVKPHYWIYKQSIIDYVLSEDYASRRLRVRV
nr:DNA-binding protein [Intestinimonas timonensis]